jgi:arsenite-transporting ATPase
MRILLFTGKGGVGKTTVAAATAARIAASGQRTVVLSTDPAHSLADAFDLPLGDVPTLIADNLWGQQLNAPSASRDAWDDVREYMVGVLDWAGADAVEAERLAVVPGLDEVFALADIKESRRPATTTWSSSTAHPPAETIRLPPFRMCSAGTWTAPRETQRRVTKLARPVLDRLTSLPIAGDRVRRHPQVHDRLDGVRDLLIDGDITSARLVVNPERMVVAKRAVRSRTSPLRLPRRRRVANRMLPDAIDDPWFARWRRRRPRTRHDQATCRPLPVLAAELADHELSGLEQLADFGQTLYGSLDPVARLAEIEPLRVDAVGSTLVLSLHLPFTERNDVRLGRSEAELFLTVGPHRRALVLPDSLLRREVTGAHLVGDRLEVEFA